MQSDQKDLRNDISLGEEVFEHLPNDIRPAWAGLVLFHFHKYINGIPQAVQDLFPIIHNKERWKEAHAQFQKIRGFLLKNKRYKPEAYLLLAELVAKVTYNASGSPAPFDRDSGHYIPSIALQLAYDINDVNLQEDIRSVILMFHRMRDRNLEKLTTFDDLILYRTIDHILWYHWDPIGIRGLGPRDEYLCYVPMISSFVKGKADRSRIADSLYRLETEQMGLVGSREKCINVAGILVNSVAAGYRVDQ